MEKSIPYAKKSHLLCMLSGRGKNEDLKSHLAGIKNHSKWGGKKKKKKPMEVES